MEKSAKSFQWQMPLYFALAFGVWIFCFWGFLTSRLSLASDALSYYDHIKFFVESICNGIFPLWDPLFNGTSGTSNDFFLRRIGPYNPLYVLMAFCVKLGISYRLVYLWGMSFYFFSGVIALYLCAAHVYKNQAAAYAGSMVLLFSALGTRIFDSYMILIVVPLIWFFYFCIVFCTQWKRWSFLGLVLCLGVLLTTYIPLYFLVFLFICFFIFILVYPQNLKPIFAAFINFVRQNKLLVACAALLLMASLIPSAMLVHSASQSQLVIPGRHGEATAGDQLQVGYNLASDWGIPEDLFYSSYFSNLKRIRFAVVYVPIFAICVLLMGLVNPIRRSTVFIFLTAFVLLSIFVPHLFPMHNWLFDHVSFFKYFRNLHFFLWFMLMPLLAFFVADQLHGFMVSLREKKWINVWICTIHIAMLAWLIYCQDILWANYFSIVLSFCFFFLCAQYFAKVSSFLIPFIFIVVLWQPIEVYKWFSKNAAPYIGLYEYDRASMNFKFKNDVMVNEGQRNRHLRSSLYVAPYWYNYFYSNVDDYNFNLDGEYRLKLYNHKRVYDDVNALLKDPEMPLTIKEGSEMVRILSYNANELSIATNFDQKKFLVYNDSYDPFWSVSINNRPAVLYRANVAFKGAWVPEGFALITFKYGKPWQYLLNFALLFTYSFVFGILLWLRVKDDQTRDI